MKCLTIVDDATHEAVAIVPARAFGGLPVTRVLDRLAITRGLPRILRTACYEQVVKALGAVGVIGCREIDAQHPEDRCQEALGLTQR